jgi:hypothetical protein
VFRKIAALRDDLRGGMLIDRIRVAERRLHDLIARGIPRAAMSSAASGSRTVEPATEEDF